MVLILVYIARDLQVLRLGSAEIRLAQRILWLFPKPPYSRFDTLKAVDDQFTENLGM